MSDAQLDNAPSKPQLPATAVYAEIGRHSKNVVFVTVKVMDSKGDTYYFKAACFGHDLKNSPEEV